MLQRDPRLVAHRVWQRTKWWWRRGSSRVRLRRHLTVCFIPVTLALLTVIGKIISTMLTGQAAVSDFTHHNIDALRDDISTLQNLNFIEPGQVSFIAGDLAVLEGNLDTADKQFAAALERSSGPDSCPARVNLELVRETRGDLAADRAATSRAEELYNSALKVISDAPPHCFTDNNDPSLDRRRIRSDAEFRVLGKIAALHLPPASPPPSPQTVTSGPPPTSLTSSQLPPSPPPGATSTPSPPPRPSAPPGNGPVFGPNGGGGGNAGPLDDISPDRIPIGGGGAAPQHRLGTGGNPLDQLQDTLGDSDATGSSGEDTGGGTHT